MKKEITYICDYCKRYHHREEDGLACEARCREEAALDQARRDKQLRCNHNWVYRLAKVYGPPLAYFGIDRSCPRCSAFEELFIDFEKLNQAQVQALGAAATLLIEEIGE